MHHSARLAMIALSTLPPMGVLGTVTNLGDRAQVASLATQHRSTSPATRRQPEVATLVPRPLPPLIGNPTSFYGDAEGLVLVDFSDMAIHATNAAGAWQHVRRAKGGGPGEFRSIFGLALGGRSALWVSDVENGRRTRLSRGLEVLEERTMEESIGRITTPDAAGRFLAIPRSVQHIAVVVDSAGRTIRRVPFPQSLAELNPILRERELVRLSDSVSVIQFRWLDHRVMLGNDGSILAEYAGTEPAPKVLAMKLDERGSTAFRVDPDAHAFALDIATRGDTLLLLRGSTNERDDGRIIERYSSATGRRLSAIRLPNPMLLIATAGPRLFAIGEGDDGYVMFEVQEP